jgi:hypothetical protein
MPFTREELDWIEAEWAYHLHGRSAFLSREDFLQVQAWEGEGATADGIVGAMEAYFTRRAARPGARTFVAMSHLSRDVAKAVKLRKALLRLDAPAGDPGAWEGVKEPLRSDPRARAAFEAWDALKASAPAPDSPGFLDHFDRERAAFRELIALAEARLGPRREPMAAALAARLKESKLLEGTLVWKRAWDHHWARAVSEAWGLS